MEEEIKKEIMEDSMQTKPLPWMMFNREQDKTKACAEEVPGSTVTEVMEKRGGMAFNIEYKSKYPSFHQSALGEFQSLRAKILKSGRVSRMSSNKTRVAFF